jgi:hypothetical protein
MNKIWCFGDSFTAGHGCIPGYQYYDEYRTDGDMIWTEHLSKSTGLEVINLGKMGYSNYSIFDSIVENYQKIKKNDIVIIGKTFPGRFDIPYNNQLKNVFSSIEKTDSLVERELSEFSGEVLETIINFQYYFASNKLYKKRQDNYFQFITNLLKDTIEVKQIIEWDISNIKFIHGFDTIINDSNSKIIDYHFSFKGHKEFSEWVLLKLNGYTKLL